MPPISDTPSDEDRLRERARRRVGRKLGFCIHAAVFVVVNLGLFAVNAATGEPRWFVFPLMGWGLGLAIHGVVTLVGLRGEGVRERMLAREIEILRRQRR